MGRDSNYLRIGAVSTHSRPQPDHAEAAIRQEGESLGPWHLEVEVTPTLTTEALRGPTIDRIKGFYDPAPGFKGILERLFPAGLEGRSVLDCACNNGAFLYAAKELGAGRCLGTDVRELWIEQARFLQRHRTGPSDDMRFDVVDLYELPALDLEPFDLTVFSGVFYHLPDPIRGLQIAADLTREVIYIASTTLAGREDGMLAPGQETTTEPLSGVYGLQWYPTGPGVFEPVMRWLDFPHTRTIDWWSPDDSAAELEVTQVFASRDASVVERWDAVSPKGFDGAVEWVKVLVPPGGTVLVAGGAEAPLHHLERRTAAFPPDVDENAGSDRTPDGELIDALERLRADAAYLLVPTEAFQWLDAHAEFGDHLKRYQVYVSDPDRCILYRL